MTDYPALDPELDPSAKQEKQFWHNVANPRACFVAKLEELMIHAIDAATLSSSPKSGFHNGRRGGPFGVAAAIPWKLKTDTEEILEFSRWFPSLSQPEREPLVEANVVAWRVIVRAGNLVEVLNDYTAHAEGMFARYIGAVCGGRNLWKRFVVLATSGAPCNMCAEALGAWGYPRIVLSGAPIAQAVIAGFHEALPEALVTSIRSNPELFHHDSDPWVGAFRAKGISVRTGVMMNEVVNRLYLPYLNSGGVLYNSGPADPSG